MQAFPEALTAPPPATAAAGGRGRGDLGGRLAALLQPDQARLDGLGLLQPGSSLATAARAWSCRALARS